LPKGEKSLAICRRDVSNFAPHIRDKFEHPSAGGSYSLSVSLSLSHQDYDPDYIWVFTEFVLPRVGMKWAVACTDSWYWRAVPFLSLRHSSHVFMTVRRRLISRVSGELKQIVRSPSGQAWAIDHQQRLHMWDGEKWLQATPRTEAFTLGTTPPSRIV
jgi:hypothetical protein